MDMDKLPKDWPFFIEAVLDIDLDINITIGEMDELANNIILAAAMRGVLIPRQEIIKHLKHKFVETKIKHDVLDIQAQVDVMPRGQDKYLSKVRRNVRSFLQRRGSASTRKYLAELCSTYPEHRHVYEEVLRGLP
tara:strand:- start:93 stop:497 length:405 start_codon:yes stop_codon:yes gene_type:complete